KGEANMDSIRWLARYIRRYRGRCIFASVLNIIVGLLNIVTLYISGMIVVLVIQGGQGDLLIPLLLVMIGGTLFRTWLRYFYQIRLNILVKMSCFSYEMICIQNFKN